MWGKDNISKWPLFFKIYIIVGDWKLKMLSLTYLFFFKSINSFNQYNIPIMKTFLKIQKNKVRKNIQTKMKLMNQPIVSLFSVLFCVSF